MVPNKNFLKFFIDFMKALLESDREKHIAKLKDLEEMEVLKWSSPTAPLIDKTRVPVQSRRSLNRGRRHKSKG